MPAGKKQEIVFDSRAAVGKLGRPGGTLRPTITEQGSLAIIAEDSEYSPVIRIQIKGPRGGIRHTLVFPQGNIPDLVKALINTLPAYVLEEGQLKEVKKS